MESSYINTESCWRILQINVNENRRGCEEWTIQKKNWQHCVHKTQDTRQRQKPNNATCVRHHYIQTYVNNVNNT